MIPGLNAHDRGIPLDLFRYSSALRTVLEKHLEPFEPRVIAAGGRRAAAVCLTVCRDGDKPAIIVTRRSATLRAHSRQWALPGGRRDQGESAIEGALRELHEEVGLFAGGDAVLGVLDDYATRSGYVITPVVVWGDCDWRDLTPNPAEVDFLRPFPFRELARPDSPVLQRIAESDGEVLSMNFHDDVIYSPTGAMLYQFREVALFGRHTRVAHFEQPLFAWR
ncbi:NUDIX hydrolase [Pseudohaliea rubra]|uniref:Putative nudix hydrolase YeaB n=1 Tax=Pseudohaliea rubra DSM 19751 TaxID=1265313 RepID=A0A095VUC3_9GAMM|nr:CoA pyrophosphatase [Pseudohaliea rubra]KGE04633.1 putative nudix hydrolase YeaB [Pseudohaliea rubra DSM 19751]